MIDAKVVNSLSMNQAYCLQINSETDITDPLIRANKEIETTYEQEVGKIFERNGLKYFVVFRDENAGFIESLDFNILVELKNKYASKFFQYKDLLDE